MVDAVVPVPLFPGVAAFLAAMQAAGVPTGIASNAGASFIRGVLAQHGLTVEVVIGRTDAARSKPHPDVFIECARRLGVASDERAAVFAFDDAPHGIKAAVAAGVVPGGVATGHTPDERRDAGATATVAHLEEALAHFERLSALR
jgi:HAD superfamily hydrolase (TIGR01509 family)